MCKICVHVHQCARIHRLHLCMHSVYVYVCPVYPVDPVAIVTVISRVCLCCVESPVRGARRRKEHRLPSRSALWPSKQ